MKLILFALSVLFQNVTAMETAIDWHLTEKIFKMYICTGDPIWINKTFNIVYVFYYFSYWILCEKPLPPIMRSQLYNGDKLYDYKDKAQAQVCFGETVHAAFTKISCCPELTITLTAEMKRFHGLRCSKPTNSLLCVSLGYLKRDETILHLQMVRMKLSPCKCPSPEDFKEHHRQKRWYDVVSLLTNVQKTASKIERNLPIDVDMPGRIVRHWLFLTIDAAKCALVFDV